MTDISKEPPAFVYLLLLKGYQVRFYYTVGGNSVVYGFRCTDAKKISVVYHKGIKDFAQIKFAQLEMHEIFEPLYDKNGTLLELKKILVFPGEWIDFLSSEEHLEGHHDEIIGMLQEFQREQVKPAPRLGLLQSFA